jgi:H+/Cl- antiporter ClcA
MREQEETESSDEKSIPISPSLEAVEGATHFPRSASVVDWRSMQITLVALLVGLLRGLVAQGLMLLIRFINTLCFYGSFSAESLSPTVSHLGIWVIFVPVIGGLIVGMMAYYGSKAIRGHGIPEAMEQVLINQSRIPPRLTFLKPVSAAITIIGTGGPFGAEGPIIATGGSLGSLVGQRQLLEAPFQRSYLPLNSFYSNFAHVL